MGWNAHNAYMDAFQFKTENRWPKWVGAYSDQLSWHIARFTSQVFFRVIPDNSKFMIFHKICKGAPYKVSMFTFSSPQIQSNLKWQEVSQRIAMTPKIHNSNGNLAWYPMYSKTNRLRIIVCCYWTRLYSISTYFYLFGEMVFIRELITYYRFTRSS